VCTFQAIGCFRRFRAGAFGFDSQLCRSLRPSRRYLISTWDPTGARPIRLRRSAEPLIFRLSTATMIARG
jgi:hypothetical protein